MQSSQFSREIEVLIEGVVQQLEDAIEAATLTRARELTEEYLRKIEPRPRAIAPVPTTTPQLQLEARRPELRRRRAPKAIVAKAPPPVDPESERRAAELARLRAILRPTAPTPAPVVAPTPMPAREQAPEDSLQSLENRIRDEIPALSSLSQGRCTARIASWVGRVRLHQSGPDAERTRIASRILLDKLRNLAWSMDAGKIEGLDLSWSTRNWQRYIEESELIAATPDAAPAKPSEPEADASSDASSESSSDADVWATPS